MSEVSVELSFETSRIRSVIRDGEPWFVARDVCEALDIQNVSQAVEPLDPDEKGKLKTATRGGLQELLIISESGLYSLMLRSNGATTPGTRSHTFRRWVTREVIPSLRKTGQYRQEIAKPTLQAGYLEIDAKISEEFIHARMLSLGGRWSEEDVSEVCLRCLDRWRRDGAVLHRVVGEDGRVHYDPVDLPTNRRLLN